jgi:uncharacterized membrane protein
MLSRFLKNTRGNIAVASAVILPVMVMFAAFGVDEGSLYYERRNLQGATDIAAIVAAANIQKAELAAHLALAANGVPESEHRKVTVETGFYKADKTVLPLERFTPGGATRNAVRVSVEKPGTLYFAGTFASPPNMSTVAVATADAQAVFAVGSRLASLNGGIVNQLLSGLLGTSISLSVMDYNALLASRVNVLSFFDAMATELDITAGTYNDVMSANAEKGQIAHALVATTPAGSDANQALNVFANDAKFSTVSVPLSGIMDLGTLGNLKLGQTPSAYGATVSAMDIISGAAVVADGQHQVALNLGATVPGVASVTVDLAIGEPPQHSHWLAIGAAGEVVRTAQTRLRLVAQVGGTGLLSGVSIKLPIYLDLAYAEAQLKSVSCPSGHPNSATAKIDTTPGIVDMWLGEVAPTEFGDFSASPSATAASIINTSLIKAKGLAHVKVGNEQAETLTFSSSEIAARTVKNVSTHDFTGSLTKNLINDLELEVQVGALSLIPPALIKPAVVTILGAVTPAVDSVINAVLQLAGVKLGEADVWVEGVLCQRSVLVQ